ncbi:MAG TPA: DUF6702 family protein [Gemmatimonadaceae bacterium]
MTHLLAMLFAMHPLHTTMTELTINSATHTIRAQTRVFADDFGRASQGSTSGAAYIASRVTIVDASKKAIALRDCGTKRTGDLLWICVEGAFSGDASALHVSNALLCELFDDQINIVQVVDGTQRRSMLFVKGDRPKGIT